MYFQVPFKITGEREIVYDHLAISQLTTLNEGSKPMVEQFSAHWRAEMYNIINSVAQAGDQ